jgi:Flp pilus assembly protein TadG
MHLKSARRRRGAHLVEFSLVFGVLMVLLAGLAVCVLNVFSYQQVAYLARETARYAAVHAGQYQQENAAAITAGTLPNVTDSYLTTNVTQASAVNLDLSQLQVAINFNTSSGSYDWDDTTNNGDRWPYSTRTVNGTAYNETNTVSVTVTYTYYPVWYLSDPITVTSTAVMPVCY